MCRAADKIAIYHSDGNLSDSEDITITVNAVPLTGDIGGTVTDADSTMPITGATVTDGTRSATTNPDGSYTIYDVPQGTCTVTVSATTYHGSSKDVTVTAGAAAIADFSTPKLLLVLTIALPNDANALTLTKTLPPKPTKALFKPLNALL